MPTPLHVDQTLDFDGLSTLVDFYSGKGVQGLTVLGSGGELPYFSDQEQLDVLSHVVSITSDKTPIIMGLYSLSAQQALTKIKTYEPYASAILLMLDQYYDVPFAAYKKAFEDIAAKSNIPIIFYYFPQITGRLHRVDELVQLLNIPNVIGIKDSSLHFPTAKAVISKVPHTLYFSGLSLMLKHLYPIGAAGAICPLASIAPAESAKYSKQLLVGVQDIVSKDKEILDDLLPIINNLNLSSNLQTKLLSIVSQLPVNMIKSANSPQAKTKEALRLLGVKIGSTVRAPLVQLTDNERETIKNMIKNISKI
jgi:dihydrodipicolinate synthase/N-acetylneuraminate lyase